MNRKTIEKPHVDLAPGVAEFRADVWKGLGGNPKTLPCKYLYDERGSHLFDEICELPEYYPTRTEIGILEDHIHEMTDRLGKRCVLLEFGSGNSRKTQLLLDRLDDPAAYVPLDISRDHLLAAAHDLRRRYPDVPVLPVCADYTSDIRLPAPAARAGRKAMFFPGSTLGNFEPAAAREFLARIARLLGPGGRLLIGIDLKKEPEVLQRAYDDARGVTAAFNRNILHRINRELDGTFDPESFDHRARWNEAEGRVEMHLRSDRQQTVAVAGRPFRFGTGETIWTESSYKFSRDGFAELARDSGYEVDRVWTDDGGLFSVQMLRVAPGGSVQ
jgi:dimethylhistidine N-methyltransferase